jgi:DNA polymerase delta subunit 2
VTFALSQTGVGPAVRCCSIAALPAQAPNVFFAGCQPEFACEECTGGLACEGFRRVQGHAKAVLVIPLYAAGPQGQKVMLIAVPSFAKTGQLVLLNLRTLQCEPVSCGVGS